MKAEVAVLGSPFLIILMISVDVKQTLNLYIYIYVLRPGTATVGRLRSVPQSRQTFPELRSCVKVEWPYLYIDTCF